MFVGKNDYHLRADSPCIDKGTNTGAPVDDIDRQIRPKGEACDIGADEYDNCPSIDNEQNILDSIAYLIDALNAQDIDKLMSLICTPSYFRLNDKDLESFRNTLEDIFAQGDAIDISFTIEKENIEFDGDKANVNGSYSLQGGDKTIFTYHSIYFVKENCTWKFVGDQSYPAGIISFDYSGKWNYSTGNSINSCTSNWDPADGIITITQEKNNITIIKESDTIKAIFTGTINNNELTASAIYAYNSGTIEENLSINFHTYYSGEGNSTWTWTDGTVTCVGGSELEFLREYTSNISGEGNSNDDRGGDDEGGCFISTGLFNR